MYFGNPFRKHPLGYQAVIRLALEIFDGWIPGNPNVVNLSVVEDTITRNLVPSESYVDIDYALSNYAGDSFYIVPVKDKWMNFITCDGVKQFLSFHFYVAPFDSESWFAYLCFTL